MRLPEFSSRVPYPFWTAFVANMSSLLGSDWIFDVVTDPLAELGFLAIYSLLAAFAALYYSYRVNAIWLIGECYKAVNAADELATPSKRAITVHNIGACVTCFGFWFSGITGGISIGLAIGTASVITLVVDRIVKDKEADIRKRLANDHYRKLFEAFDDSFVVRPWLLFR